MAISFSIPKPRREYLYKKNNSSSAANIIKRISFFVAGAALSGVFSFTVNGGQTPLENFFYAQISAPLDNMVYATSPARFKTVLELDAKSALSFRIAANGREKIIYKKNIDGQLPIASLTKLMTANVVVESPDIYHLDRQIVISPKAAGQDDVPVFGNLKAGEVYSVRQLLNLMLFYSSNDAAYALAEIMGEDAFVRAMNDKAAQMGLEKTYFYNPHGLDLIDGKTNFSSAGDILVLTRYVLDNHPEIFSYTMKAGPYLTENGIFNLNFWDKQIMLGGKTGYTQQAGGCMVLAFENSRHSRYINILLGAPTSEKRVVEMQKLINYSNNSDI